MKLTRPQRPAILDRLTGAVRRSAEAAAARAASVYDRIEAAMRSLEAACEPLLAGPADATALATAARAYSDYKAAQQALGDLAPRWREPEIHSCIERDGKPHHPRVLIIEAIEGLAAALAWVGVPVPELPDRNDWAALAQWCEDLAAMGA